MISLLLPSRGRPENLARLVDSVNETACGDVELIVYTDDDDTGYPASSGNVRVFSTARQSRMAMYWNMAFEKASGDIVMQASDDIVFRTPGWDDQVRRAFELLPYFSADYTDTWLNDLADRIDRKHKVPILTEHMHFTYHKGTLDLTHAERLVRLWRDDNTGIYDAKECERAVDAGKLRAAMS